MLSFPEASSFWHYGPGPLTFWGFRGQSFRILGVASVGCAPRERRWISSRVSLRGFRLAHSHKAGTASRGPVATVTGV